MSPQCFHVLTHMLMSLAEGRLVVALEVKLFIVSLSCLSCSEQNNTNQTRHIKHDLTVNRPHQVTPDASVLTVGNLSHVVKHYRRYSVI